MKTNARPECYIMEFTIVGPVLCVRTFETEEEAIQVLLLTAIRVFVHV